MFAQAQFIKSSMSSEVEVLSKVCQLKGGRKDRGRREGKRAGRKEGGRQEGGWRKEEGRREGISLPTVTELPQEPMQGRLSKIQNRSGGMELGAHVANCGAPLLHHASSSVTQPQRILEKQASCSGMSEKSTIVRRPTVTLSRQSCFFLPSRLRTVTPGATGVKEYIYEKLDPTCLFVELLC